ncbi:MAG: ZinT/AdcA family metal-binding protein [Clostridia bacterium]|nr:ZinT/AdcA family metal-binding protein [Clostridia bacterium]
MKKVLSALLVLVLMMTTLLTGAAFAEEKKLSIVTTIFPIYDWVRQIVGDNDNVEITMLLDNGIDLHSYQPSAQDILKVSTADLFIYVGGESDEWVEDVLETAQNPSLVAINLVEAMGDAIKMEEIVEGMEHEHEHEHEESDAHSHEVSTFEDDQVENRPLSNWAGEWQSAYPYALDGSLDEGFAHKAESGKMTAEEYKQYYITGYETDIAKIVIDGDTNVITYTDVSGNTCQSEYKALGYYIQNWSTGTKAAMYRFEAVDKESGAPIFIEFNDHIIEDVKAEHFHFRASSESFDAIEDPENKWPTFYPADFDADEMLAAFVGHDHANHEHEHDDEITLDDIKDRTLAEFDGNWQSTYPLMLDGSLQPVMEHKAEEDASMTVEQYTAKYMKAYETDWLAININAPTVEYVTADGSYTADYEYAGYYIRYNDEERTSIRQVRFQFKKTAGDDKAPEYIVFSDHNNAPAEVEHFHIYAGNDGFDVLGEESVHFPTFYPASLSAKDIVEEMTGSHDHGHDHEHEHEEEADEHVWLSLRNAKALCKVIAEALSKVDPDNAGKYLSNLTAYEAQLIALDKAYEETVNAAAYKTVLFGDRFPFRYLVDDYGLTYFAAFSGCSAESEASFQTIVFLAQKVDELNLPAVLTIEHPKTRIAETVVSTSQAKNAKILSMDSMQSITAQDVKAGSNYLSIMESNLAVLKDALN